MDEFFIVCRHCYHVHGCCFVDSPLECDSCTRNSCDMFNRKLTERTILMELNSAVKYITCGKCRPLEKIVASLITRLQGE